MPDRLEASDQFCFLYSPFPDAESAKACAHRLVERGLAACVNIYPPMTSIYRWQGVQEESAEVAVFIKTRRALAAAVIEAARPLHPYTTPCFLMLPIAGGNADYLAWAHAQTLNEPPQKI
jgi:periplasmic divalent cation tolerance protein